MSATLGRPVSTGIADGPEGMMTTTTHTTHLTKTGERTHAIHAGLPRPTAGEPALPGPVFAAHYTVPGEPAASPYTYGRDGNPTWTLLEAALGELELPGEAVETILFSSGMAACSGVLFSQLGAGEAVVLPDNNYHGLSLLAERLAAFGVEVRRAPTAGDAQLELLDGARLLWIESLALRRQRPPVECPQMTGQHSAAEFPARRATTGGHSPQGFHVISAQEPGCRPRRRSLACQ